VADSPIYVIYHDPCMDGFSAAWVARKKFGDAVSFYAYDAGESNWRAIVLNSASTEGPAGNLAPSCSAGSPQMNFLINELKIRGLS
jgi:hypothetical protein